MGCGSGGSTSTIPTTFAGLTGRVLVPSTSLTRATADVPLTGAAVTLTDITNGLPGTTAGTTTTDSNGTYRFANVQAGHSYLLVATKPLTGGAGLPSTLSLGAYVHLSSTASQAATTDIDTGSTVGLGYVVQQITANASLAGTDLGSDFQAVAQAFDAERQTGTAPDMDLSKPCTDPKSHSDTVQQTLQQALRSGAFLSAAVSGQDGSVNLLFDKGSRQIDLVLVIRDSSGDVFDADYFSSVADTTGAFSGTTRDGLYTVTGALLGSSAQGTWAANDGSDQGSWQAAIPQNSGPHRGVGYDGTYTVDGTTGPQGKWFIFVGSDGNALIFGHDEAYPTQPHLLKTIVLAAQFSTTGAVTGQLVFPVETGTLSGSDPTQGGTASVSGSQSSGQHTGSVEGSLTGQVTGNVVTGTWSFHTLTASNTSQSSGTWTGVQR